MLTLMRFVALDLFLFIGGNLSLINHLRSMKKKILESVRQNNF